MDQKTALIVGVGGGLSASLARLFAANGMGVALAARNTEKLIALAKEAGAAAHACDAAKPEDVARLFAALPAPPDVVVFNPSARVPGPIAEIDPEAAARALSISAYGGFLVGQAAAKAMLPRGSGTILFTGASASVKGYPRSAVFAMGKFALRGLAQSMARELAPRGIHVAHVVIDGGIRSTQRQEPADAPDSMLDPDAIALSYLHLANQHRSAWTWEIEVRPWVERF
ncbi:MAG: SDR family NAD(P)-dependent oxidoreductase [Proteobacteria bacterium]|nr:SDR family NAD(P)-dependent oxidoreductase [Pseudomonadota bacterium]